MNTIKGIEKKEKGPFSHILLKKRGIIMVTGNVVNRVENREGIPDSDTQQ
jgi:hypothetical protein